MTPLGRFIAELRAARHYDESIEKLEPIFHKLQQGDNPVTIQMHDDIVDIVRRKSPLPERVIAIAKLLSGWLQ